MDIIVKLSSIGIDPGPIAEGDVPPEVLADIHHELSEAYIDAAADKEAYLYQTYEREVFLFGSLQPKVLIERAKKWNLEIREEFLRCLDAVCHISERSRLPIADELELNTDATYQLSCAARELNNSWYDYAEHAVYLENKSGWPYFKVQLSAKALEDILAHPEEYAIVGVWPKS